MKYITIFIIVIVVFFGFVEPVFALDEILPVISAPPAYYWEEIDDYCTGVNPIHIDVYYGDPFTGTYVPAGQTTPCNLITNTSFALANVPGANSNRGGAYYVTATSSTHGIFFSFDYSSTTTEITGVPGATRIVSFTPTTTSVVATGTQTVGFSWYLNINDWNGQPAYFTYRLVPSGPPIASSAGAVITGEVPITTFGTGSFSTTTFLTQQGINNVEASINYSPVCIIGFCSFYETTASSSWFYTTATTSGFTDLNNSIQDEISALLASTTLAIGNVCSPFSTQFNVVACVTSMLIPPAEVLAGDFNSLSTLPPWGYGFRFYDILSGEGTTTTVSLPELSYTSGTTSIFEGATFSFDPFGTLSSTTGIVNSIVSDQAEPKNVWEIMSPMINLIVYLSLAFMIIHDVTGLKRHSNQEIS